MLDDHQLQNAPHAWKTSTIDRMRCSKPGHAENRKALIALLLHILFAAVAYSQNTSGRSWQGKWYYDASSSHIPTHTYWLIRLTNGSLERRDGKLSFQFAMDGRSYPEPDGDTSISVTRLDGRHFDYAEASTTGTTVRHQQQLSVDSRTIIDKAIKVYANGQKREEETTTARISGGPGFEGAWKTTPKPYVPPAGPFWVISLSPDGMMKWNIPFTGEVIYGKADGKSRPIVGPSIPPGITFTWRQRSSRRLDFYASKDGRVEEVATEVLSTNGRTFTDTLWSAGNENEKRISVFHKQ